MWGQREMHYAMTLRQKNKVRLYELIFFSKGNPWGETIGFFNTKKEAREFAKKHKNSLAK